MYQKTYESRFVPFTPRSRANAASLWILLRIDKLHGSLLEKALHHTRTDMSVSEEPSRVMARCPHLEVLRMALTHRYVRLLGETSRASDDGNSCHARRLYPEWKAAHCRLEYESLPRIIAVENYRWRTFQIEPRTSAS
ncbi:hypothetical protein AC578_7557 [Pseudocercospora eumusae]|uniref:Uncharacterized protein n=1 Tax=Pseudocercospora eumusae TaxID=321146 RepID=A0A139HRI8_9PEZI|nr:hypothetical protein AC578_7557 [Pseudocercospora eumusae]